MIIDKAKIGLRCQDIQTGLQDVNVDEYAPGEFQTLPLTGMAARLALHIRGRERLDQKQLYTVASKLGIKSTEVSTVIARLEELGWVSSKASSGRVEKVLESIPYFSDLYEALGDQAETHGLTELEQASIHTLECASNGPVLRESLERIGIENRLIDDVYKIGEEGAYLRSVESSSGHLIYSPLYWQENEECFSTLVSSFSDETIRTAIAKVRSTQGTPMDLLGTSPADEVIKESIRLGLLPTPSVNSTNGEKRFTFTPFTSSEKIELIEKHVYEKALLILSCVRYGEHFAAITKIADPVRILSALLDQNRQHRIGPHSEIKLQYSTLVIRNVGTLIRAEALDLLRAGEPIQDRGVLLGQEEELLSVSDYKESLRSSRDLKSKSQIKVSRQESIRFLSEFAELLSRGSM
jgi:hypothetical protein